MEEKRQRAWPCDTLEEALRKVEALGVLGIDCKLEHNEPEPGMPSIVHFPYLVIIVPFAVVNEDQEGHGSHRAQ